MVNLVWKSHLKIVKSPKKHLIFMNFGVKNFTIINDPQIKNFDV
jgi:hypothetical protein